MFGCNHCVIATRVANPISGGCMKHTSIEMRYHFMREL